MISHNQDLKILQIWKLKNNNYINTTIINMDSSKINEKIIIFSTLIFQKDPNVYNSID